MTRLLSTVGVAVSCAYLAGCATVAAPAERGIDPSLTREAQTEATKPVAPTLKRRIAVARFSNSTNYGKGLLYDGENDPLADQAMDMLVKRLVETEYFLVFERSNIDALQFENQLNGDSADTNLVGVDAVIIGSVTEFGRSTEGQVGFLSSTKKQTVDAAVDARLVDPKTGLAFFSASGRGQSSTESGEVAGFGSRAAYDASLNDQAISAAVSDLTSEIISGLTDRPWSTDILQVRGDQVFISGGNAQGLKAGDLFVVETLGETIKSEQSGMPIRLPGDKVAVIEVGSFFGDSEYSEGSVCTIVDGSLGGHEPKNLIVREATAQ